MFSRITALFFFILLGLSYFSEAQNYPLKHFGPQEGLAHSNVFRIFQDKKGFLWFGTETGLSQFNSRFFTSYKSTESISLNTITYIGEDATGDKVICTYAGGINKLIGDSISPMMGERNILINTIISGQLLDDRLWFIAKAGGLYYLKNRKIYMPVVQSHQGKEIQFSRILLLKSGQLLFTSNTGLHTLGRNDEIIPYLPSIITGRVYNLAQTPNGDIWAGLSGKIIRLRHDTVYTVYPTGTQNEISDFIITREGKIWAAIPDHGILIWEDTHFRNVTSQLNMQHILVNDLFEDYDGNIWIATHGSGLYCVQSMNVLNYPVQEGKVNNYATTIISHKNKVYVGSIGTVSVCDTGGMKPVKLSNLDPAEYIYFIRIIGENLYVGTPRGIIIKKVEGPESDYLIPTRGAVAICEGREGIWLSRFGDIGLLDGSGYHVNDGLSRKINARITSIIQTEEGILFLGTGKGLYSYDGKTVKKIFGGDGPPFAINNLFVDSKNRVWACTSWGLVVVKNGTIKRYTAESGLRNNHVTAVAEDRSGQIIVATLSGLDRFNEKTFSSLDDGLGLISQELLTLCIDNQQEIWVGAVNGVSHILKKQASIPRELLRTYITAIYTGNKKTTFPNRLTIPFGRKGIRIDFAALSFPSSEKVEYRYIIEGLDTEWRTVFTNSVELSSLPAGRFIFKLEARQQFGEWTKPVRLELFIPTPFWLQWWFVLISILFLCLAIYFVLRRFLLIGEKKRKEQVAIKSKMIHLKQQALAALINPHFVFNCLNSIQIFIQRNDPELANKYLVQFAHLIRITLDNAAESFIRLKDEIDRLRLYMQMEQLRFSDRLSFSVHVASELDQEEIMIPNMVLQPYLENAVKHGIMGRQEGGIVNVSFEKDRNGAVRVCIEDNGPGIYSAKKNKPQKATHRSLGMKLTSERLELLEQIHQGVYTIAIEELSDKTGNPTGTRISFLFDTRGKE